MSSEYAPIALFVYKRPEHTLKTVQALQANSLAQESKLFVFAEAPTDETEQILTQQVAEIFTNLTSFKSVEFIPKTEHTGLASSIIGAVTSLVKAYGKVIVVEDDMITSKYFLSYLNQGLELYKDDDGVASIHAYTPVNSGQLPESYFLRGADCWGWATWQRAWQKFNPNSADLLTKFSKKERKIFDFNGSFPYYKMLKKQSQGRVDSWAIRWYASAFLNNMYTLYPNYSLVENIGLDGSGTHCGVEASTELNPDLELNLQKVTVAQCETAFRLFAKQFSIQQRQYRFWVRVKRRLQRYLKGGK